MVLSCIALVFPPFAPNMWILSLSIVILGLFLSSLDCAMNAHAVAVERVYAKPIMSSLHGLFSIGGVVFAAFGSAMAALNVVPEIHFFISAVVLLILGLATKGWLLPASADATGEKVKASLHLDSLKQLWSSSVLMASGVVMLCCFLIEGAMGDWSGVFLHKVLGTDTGFAALGYTAFSATMCSARLTGDWIKQRIGATAIISAGSLIAIGGLALVVFPSVPVLAVLGFALVGLGVANIVPLGFSCAGNAPNSQPGMAIASVSMMGYVGLLAGPPMVGFLAQLLTLRVALGLLTLLIIAMICMAGGMIGGHGEELG
jgi:Na+/melibiose symporter-like transporter